MDMETLTQTRPVRRRTAAGSVTPETEPLDVSDLGESNGKGSAADPDNAPPTTDEGGKPKTGGKLRLVEGESEEAVRKRKAATRKARREAAKEREAKETARLVRAFKPEVRGRKLARAVRDAYAAMLELGPEPLAAVAIITAQAQTRPIRLGERYGIDTGCAVRDELLVAAIDYFRGGAVDGVETLTAAVRNGGWQRKGAWPSRLEKLQWGAVVTLSGRSLPPMKVNLKTSLRLKRKGMKSNRVVRDMFARLIMMDPLELVIVVMFLLRNRWCAGSFPKEAYGIATGCGLRDRLLIAAVGAMHEFPASFTNADLTLRAIFKALHRGDSMMFPSPEDLKAWRAGEGLYAKADDKR